MHASGSGYSVICLILLQYGAQVDFSSAEGMTALHFAATNGDSYVTQQIVEAGRLITIRFHFNRMVIIYCWGGEEGCQSILVMSQ